VANLIVLDASVRIAYLYGGDPVHARAQDLVAHEVDDDFAADTARCLRSSSYQHARAGSMNYELFSPTLKYRS
jgi:hypothetical protein